MSEILSPNDPQEFKKWVDQVEEKWLAGLIPNPRAASVIITNSRREVLFLVRDNNPNISFPNCWSLPGGVVEYNELPEQAAQACHRYRRNIGKSIATILFPRAAPHPSPLSGSNEMVSRQG